MFEAEDLLVEGEAGPLRDRLNWAMPLVWDGTLSPLHPCVRAKTASTDFPQTL